MDTTKLEKRLRTLGAEAAKLSKTAYTLAAEVHRLTLPKRSRSLDTAAERVMVELGGDLEPPSWTSVG
jgi:hypothetical protein